MGLIFAIEMASANSYELLLEALRVLARKRDVPYQSLLKIYLAERIEREFQHPARLAIRRNGRHAHQSQNRRIGPSVVAQETKRHQKMLLVGVVPAIIGTGVSRELVN